MIGKRYSRLVGQSVEILLNMKSRNLVDRLRVDMKTLLGLIMSNKYSLYSGRLNYSSLDMKTWLNHLLQLWLGDNNR